jgi:hypothetical protein
MFNGVEHLRSHDEKQVVKQVVSCPDIRSGRKWEYGINYAAKR